MTPLIDNRRLCIQTLWLNTRQIRFYTTQLDLNNHPEAIQPKDGGTVPPWFISGFADAEGTFVIIVRKNTKYRLGWKVEAVFRIGLHKRDLDLLKQIQAYFGGVGSIVKQGEDIYAYRVSSLKHLLNNILPHFDKYPLISHKRGDYLLWREVVLMLKSGQHLLMEGLQAIVNIRASINLGLSEDLKAAFPSTIPVPRPKHERSITLHPEWVAGFATGEGCFYILVKKGRNKVGLGFLLVFQIAQHTRDEELLRNLADYFKCGQYIHHKSQDWGYYSCTKFDDNYSIMQFFNKYPIRGEKSKDLADWAKVAEIIKKGDHLTIEGATLINNIKAGMNTNRTGYPINEEN